MTQIRTPSITNLGDWNQNSPILMVNNPDGSGTHVNYCYQNDTFVRTSANITVYVGYAEPPFGPIGNLQQHKWRLKFYNISPDFNYCNFDVDDTMELTNLFSDPSSPDGIYSIDRILNAGGSGSAAVKLVFLGTPLVECELGTMYFISTDINGDRATDLSDVPLFTALWNTGTYQKAIDFQYDGFRNLSDLAYFAGRTGTHCP
jgi:hypothetical protein